LTKGLFAAALLAAPAAHAELINCTVIASLPYSIGTPGTYCLKSDLTYAALDSIAINISASANPVVLDLNGHSLTYTGPKTEDGSLGIRVWPAHATVRNGAVRGFYTGVQYINTATDGLVEDLQVEDSYSAGIVVQGQRHVVRRCRISKTGVGATSGLRHGIHVYGPQHRVLDNDVSDTATTSADPAASAAGIALWNADGAIVEGNRIVNTTGPNAYGITNAKAGAWLGSNMLLVNNRISTAPGGIFLLVGTSARYRDNLTMGVTTPYAGGTDVGNNQ